MDLLPPLLRLATETRLDIFRHLLTCSSEISVWVDSQGSPNSPLGVYRKPQQCRLQTGLLRVNRRIRDEAISIMYGENAFKIHGPGIWFDGFDRLNYLFASNWNAISTLTVDPWFLRNPLLPANLTKLHLAGDHQARRTIYCDVARPCQDFAAAEMYVENVLCRQDYISQKPAILATFRTLKQRGLIEVTFDKDDSLLLYFKHEMRQIMASDGSAKPELTLSISPFKPKQPINSGLTLPLSTTHQRLSGILASAYSQFMITDTIRVWLNIDWQSGI